MKNKKPLIILTGPTAVGKTKASIGLAKRIDGEIISADSMQVYKHMNIGTAKITYDEMEHVPHHLVDILEPEDNFDVTLFKKNATAAMEDIWSRGKIPMLVGGTGFYIQAVLYDIDFTENTDEGSTTEYRKQLHDIAMIHGNEYLYDMLLKIDPKAAECIHPNNVKRVMRAIEYNHNTGMLISEHNETERAKKSPYNFAYFVLNDDRQKLYDRIDARVDDMFAAGLVDEVRALKMRGLTKEYVSMHGIGYKEVLDYLDGCTTLDETIEIIKRDTRHFAKRQLTWFKREKDVTMVDYREYDNDVEKMISAMAEYLLEHNLI